VVLIINDDTEFEPDFVERGLALLRGMPRTLVAAQAHDRASGALLDAGRHVDWRRLSFEPATSADELNCLSTRGLFMRASEFLETGGFRPARLPHYFSDYEFTIRAHRRGWRLATDPSLRLRADTTSSGLRDLPGVGLREFLRLYFSRRCVVNPMTWSTFVLLACPWPWKILHLGRIWIEAVAKIARAAGPSFGGR
jgi:GT2 family glycosyltransferase